MKVANLDQAPYLRMLVYGDSGSGKTTLLGTAMQCKETFPLLVLNARGQPISLRYLKHRPLVLEIETIKDFNIIYTWLLGGQGMEILEKLDRQLHMVVSKYLHTVHGSKFEHAPRDLQLGLRKFKSLAVDSITQVQRLAMEQIVGGTMPANPATVPTQTQIQHWGRTLALMTNFADKFFQLPLHVIMTALTRRENIPAMGLTLFCPFLWGQSNLEIPSHAEIVGRLMCTGTIPVKQQKGVTTAASQAGQELPFNIMYLKGGRDYMAKWQGIQNAPAMMANPTIAKFIKRYETGS